MMDCDIPSNEIWKTGNLYQKTTEDMPKCFRRSVFTIFLKSKHSWDIPQPQKNIQEAESERYWTMLLLTPSDFFQSFDELDHRHTIRPIQDWRNIGIQRCILAAELTSICYAMALVVKRWEDLYQHIKDLLHQDFMDPTTYSELLFDDETFSQSWLCFWVIGYLNEFQISIEDNIKQWKLFREARVEPYLVEN
ncbi:uncharacterized protein EAF01_007011 [Botrytis porri]|uniref:Uncharacterized protein n=1 Tax=Botrytis porri TaxID=87229 RepID=A0A4Z1KXK9_9HELO|nr:uncharacterized protein EAF01_007011 [Botrytis porri]KAF7901712.1 hypothetical protein EAF01_007011 [Botrytis porri]TGO89268.1 hypothetical protein BPOR_0117g00160 [Botrytis porri]